MQLFNLYADPLRFVNIVYFHEYPFFIPSTQHLVMCALAYYVFVMESPIYTLSRSTLSFSCLPFPSFSAPSRTLQGPEDYHLQRIPSQSSVCA